METAKTDGPRPSAVGYGTSTTLSYVINEAAADTPGNATMLDRLTELIFVEILQRMIGSPPAAWRKVKATTA